MLFTTTYAKSRFAWPAPWATVRGWPDETYGNYLVRITLKPHAIIVAMSSMFGITGARDLANRPIALDEVRRHPERIAAVYFTSRTDLPVAEGVLLPSSTYREFVVCNESMVESWAVGTDDIARELADEAALLEEVAQLDDARVARAYDAAIALRNESYVEIAGTRRVRSPNLESLAEMLRLLPKAQPFTGTSSVAFSGVGSPRTVPTKVYRAYGSYGGSYAIPYVRPKPTTP
jgi:hypothetical protein